MNNKKLTFSVVLLAVGLYSVIATHHTWVSLLGLAATIAGFWLLRQSILERRKAKEANQYQRLEPQQADQDKPTDDHKTAADPTETASQVQKQDTEPAQHTETVPEAKAVDDPEMETIRSNAMLTLIKYVMEVDTMVRMGTTQDPQKVSVDNEHLIFYRKAKDEATMQTIRMMPEMMANLAMIQMMRHENIHDVVDATYFTGKGIKTVWTDNQGETAEMVFPHVSFDRVFEETNHKPDRKRFLTKPDNIFG